MSSEATQSLGIYEFLAWLETNKKRIAIAFGAAVVIGFGISVYNWKSDQTELAASDALLKLKTSLTGGESAVQPDASAYLKIAEQYPGTSAGERAVLLAAGALFVENKYTEAHNLFSKFLQQHPQSPFAAPAAYGVASCLEAQGKQDDALAAYQNLSVRFPNASVLDDAKLATARIYESKKQPEPAYRIYEELSRQVGLGGMSSATSLAMARRQELVAQHPEFAKTNAVSASSTAAEAITAVLTNSIQAASTNSAAPKQ